MAVPNTEPAAAPDLLASSGGPADVPALFRAHYRGLVRLAAQLVDDHASAEDVVQDVFAALQVRPRALDDPLAYLRLAVVNRSRSALRRRRTARLFVFPRSESVEPADAAHLRDEAHEHMLRAVRGLPARQREVIVLRFYEDMPVADVAQLLGISPGAVASSAHRALSRLTILLEEDHD